MDWTQLFQMISELGEGAREVAIWLMVLHYASKILMPPLVIVSLTFGAIQILKWIFRCIDRKYEKEENDAYEE